MLWPRCDHDIPVAVPRMCNGFAMLLQRGRLIEKRAKPLVIHSSSQAKPLRISGLGEDELCMHVCVRARARVCGDGDVVMVVDSLPMCLT